MYRRVLLAALLWSVQTAASAETCTEAVDRLAGEYGLTAAPPSAPQEEPEAGTLSEELSETEGVLAPPDSGRTVVIEPPETPTDRMPTAPDVEPDSPSVPDETTRPELDAADRQQVEALLSEARAEAERGNREQCFERLQEAEAILRERNG